MEKRPSVDAAEKEAGAKKPKDDEAATRKKCTEMLVEALLVDFGDDTSIDDNLCDCASSIEDVLFREFKCRADAGYRTKFRSKFLNLKQNAVLRSNLLSGDLTPADFVAMTAEQMASDTQRQRDLALHRQNLLNAQYAKDTQAETDQFKCSKCKQRRCKYYQLQTRSADEPMTTFVTCVNCNNRWKFC